MKTVSALPPGMLLLPMDMFLVESATHSTILVRGEFMKAGGAVVEGEIMNSDLLSVLVPTVAAFVGAIIGSGAAIVGGIIGGWMQGRAWYHFG